MKNVKSLVLTLLTVLLSAVSCSPETINNNDEQLIEKHEVEIPTDKI